jgi:hypothetical protein
MDAPPRIVGCFTRPLGVALLVGGALSATAGLVIRAPAHVHGRSVPLAPICVAATPSTSAVPKAAPEEPSRASLSHFTLAAASDPVCYYHSVFNDADVVWFDGGAPIDQRTRFDFMDGCTWEAHEVLTPDGPGRYRYRYSERPIACRPHHQPAGACARQGVVTTSPL